MNLIIKFRDLSADIVEAVRYQFPDWDVAVDSIWSPGKADFIVSPANCTGRMDGGIDQIYIYRFGWQLERRLMRDITKLYGGRLPIGEAHAITTYDADFPMMICAPTMDWPPGPVGHTNNAYRAFLATLRCAEKVGRLVNEDEPTTVVVPGLGTGTGGMLPNVFAAQLNRAWDEWKSEER